MANVEKKMAAALAAVTSYMQEEEAIFQQQQATTTTPQPPQDMNIWGLSGRQDMMAMRQLIQMKAFNRF